MQNIVCENVDIWYETSYVNFNSYKWTLKVILTIPRDSFYNHIHVYAILPSNKIMDLIFSDRKEKQKGLHKVFG